MKFPVNVVDYVSKIEIEYELELPEVCTNCGRGFGGEAIAAYHFENTFGIFTKSRIYVLFLCHPCSSCFLSIYEKRNDNYILVDSVPHKFHGKEFSPEVSTLSPGFVKIYNQANQAEEFGLNEICGMGYRKALEILIKDYLVHKKPDDKEAIFYGNLSNVINTRIDDSRLKILAERSAWLGNDETHYIKKHNDRDISDLKLFINAAVTFIDSDLAFEEALSIEKK